MRLEVLEYFIAVVRCKSMNLAGEELHVSQQTLSMAVKSLEQELGVQLLERSYLGVSATEAGREFVLIAEQFLHNVADFKERHTVSAPVLRGRLHIYAMPAVCSSILPKLVTLFAKRYPQVEISMMEKVSSEISAAFAEDPSATKLALINVLYCGGKEISLYQVSQELVYEEFLREPYVVAAGKGSVLSGYKTVSLKTLLQYPLIFCGTKSKETNLSYHLLCQYGKPIATLVSDNPYIYLQAIIDGVGVGIMPMMSLQQEGIRGFAERVHIVPIKEKVESVSYWAMPRDNLHDELLLAFIDFSKKNKHIFK